MVFSATTTLKLGFFFFPVLLNLITNIMEILLDDILKVNPLNLNY